MMSSPSAFSRVPSACSEARHRDLAQSGVIGAVLAASVPKRSLIKS